MALAHKVFLNTLLISTLLVNGCVTTDGREFPEYPFTTTFYNDESCETKVTRGDETEVSKGQYSAQFLMLGEFSANFVILKCEYNISSKTAANTKALIYFDQVLEESKYFHYVQSSIRDKGNNYFQTDNSLSFELTKFSHLEAERERFKTVHPELMQKYAAMLVMESVTPSLYPLGFAPPICGVDLYSKSGDVIFNSFKESKDTNVYAVFTGNLITGKGRCV